MKEGVKHLKETGFTSATLWVLTSNQKTRIFYEHHGWQVDGQTKTEQKRGIELRETRYTISLN